MLLGKSHIPQFEDVEIFCTERTGGESIGKYKGFNLGIKSGDNQDSVLKNRENLADILGKQSEKFQYLNQVHAGEVCVLKYGETYTGDGYDALITNDMKNIPIILVADCVPIVVYDEIKKVIGVIHSGWKGTAKNIMANTISAMQNDFGSELSDIRVVVGPCISSKNYEVDEVVIQNFSDSFYTENKSGGYQIDLRTIIESQAKNAGILSDKLYHIDICTFERDDMFFSARRDGLQSGRFAMGIYFKEK